MQDKLMKVDPATGHDKPYPSQADQYRAYHGKIAWLVNPWTGVARLPYDIGSDVTGVLMADGDSSSKTRGIPPSD